MISIKNIFTISLVIAWTMLPGICSFAQDLAVPDEMPYFRGCSTVKKAEAKRQCSNEKLINYILGEIEYPESARKGKVEGIVYLSFVVTEKGGIEKAEILRGIGGGCDELAIAIVNGMPPWQPATIKGQPIAAKMNLPIQFSLAEEGRENELKYRIIWSNLTDRESLSRDEVKENIDVPIALLDLNGNRVQFNELSFFKTKGEKFKTASSAGAITPAMRKLVKKLKNGQYFSIVATIQVDGQFDYIEKEWEIIY